MSAGIVLVAVLTFVRFLSSDEHWLVADLRRQRPNG